MKRLTYVLFLVLGCVGWSSLAQAQLLQTINYQGILSDQTGAVVADGNYNITFRFYTQPTGGTALWAEGQSIAIVDGLFNVVLGRVNPLTLPFDQAYWLGITPSGSVELTPRIPLTASAYSFFAQGVADGIISEAKLENQAVTPAKLADGAVTSAKIADGAVTGDKIADEAVSTTQLANGTVTLPKLNAAGASAGQTLVYNGSSLNWGTPSGMGIVSDVIAGDGLNRSQNGTEITISMADGAVTSTKIADGAVTAVKIAPGAVQAENLSGSGAMAEDVLTFDGTNVIWARATGGVQPGSITDVELADNAVTSIKILDGEVQNADLADDAVTSAKLTDESVGTADLAGLSVTTAKLAGGAVTGAKIQNGAVNTVDLADDAITSAKIANDNVGPAKIDASGASNGQVLSFNGSDVVWATVSGGVGPGSITEVELANDAVTSVKIQNGAVNTVDIALDAVSSARIQDGAVSTADLSDGAVTTTKLALDAVSSARIQNGAVNTVDLADAAVGFSKIDAAPPHTRRDQRRIVKL